MSIHVPVLVNVSIVVIRDTAIDDVGYRAAICGVSRPLDSLGSNLDEGVPPAPGATACVT